MTPLDDNTLQELLRLCEAATPGPWDALSIEMALEADKWMRGDNNKNDAAFMAAADPSKIAALVKELIERREECERLRRGEFTPEEFQNLCHNADIQQGFEAFADGCEAYQRQLFGRCRRDTQ